MEGATAKHVIARVRDRGLTVGVACVAAVAVVAWPVRTIRPGVGGDWFWVAALSYVAQHGLRFGEQIVWSYGPLGFLNSWYGPVLYYGNVLLLSWLFAALVQLLLAGTLLAALRRSLPLAAAAAVSAVVLALAPDRVPALGFVWCVLALAWAGDAHHERASNAFPYAIGVLTGIAVLGKLNQGVELAALAVVALAVTWRRRDAAAFVGALLATAAVGWIATGQSLADVWPYLRNGIEVITGYAAAMGATDPSHAWTYAAAPAIVALALALAWDAARGWSSSRRWGLMALCLIYAGLTFKEGFVRQDPGHLNVFFGDMLVPLAVLPMHPSRRPILLGSVVAGVVAFGAVAGSHDLTRTLDPYSNVAAAADQLRTLVSPARRDAMTADLRAEIDARYHVPPQLVAAVGHRSVMLWPYVYGEIAYAYDLNLRPLPPLEPYTAYTPALDRLSAEMLASPRAPDRILRAVAPAIDGRLATFEAPLATLAILCRYRQVAEQEPWQLLARSDDRCGAQRTIRTVAAPWGASVVVPPPERAGALVLVRVQGAGPHGLERLQELLLRPYRRSISLDGVPHRLVEATASDGLLLHAPSRADYSGPFAMAPNPVHIEVDRDGGEPGGQLHYTFAEVPIRPMPAHARAP